MAILTYTNSTGMTIPPSGTSGLTSQALNVFGTAGNILDVSVTLTGLNHTFADDLDMLLVAPDGTSNLQFLSDAGGGADFIDATVTFSNGASSAIADSATAPIDSGSYLPSNYSIGETDATYLTSTGGINDGGPLGASTFASAFGGLGLPGLWNLYVNDDAGGDAGNLASWSLTFTTVSNVVSLGGDGGNDIIIVSPTSATSGTFTYNGGDAAAYASVDNFFINGGGGNDIIFGSDGSDILSGSTGRDQVFGAGGNDQFTLNPGTAVAGEIYDGGAGTDRLNFTAGLISTVYDLRYLTLISIEQLVYFDPGLNGTLEVRLNASQFGAGFSSSGQVFGNFFSDITDILAVTMGTISSLDLSDLTFSFFNSPSDRVIVTGDGSAETITGSEVHDEIAGNGGVDLLSGFSGNDQIEGGSGGDTLNGDAGNDRLYGSSYSSVFDSDVDILNGGANNDWLFGGAGGDSLTGGTGGDWFAFEQTVSHAGDTVLDYAAGDFLFFAGVGGATNVGVSGANLIVNGVTVTGGASRDVVIYAQTSAGLLVAPAAIDLLLAGDMNQLGTFGDYARTTYDGNNSSTWRTQVDYFTATNLLDFQWTYNDVGQFHHSLFTDFDQAGANPWNYKINYYITSGVLDFQWTYNDAGNPIHSFNTDFDQASVATWNYRITYYSALNVADYQWTYNDAGNPVHSIIHDWDQASAATWTTRTTYYSAANVADYQWTYHDVGQPYHSTYVDWDQANVETWAYHVINFSAPGVVANDYYV